MTQRHQALMIGHGAIILFLGLMVGYVFAFNLIEKVAVWPFPALDVRIPGDPERWRGAHTGIITNALMIIGVALALPHVQLSNAVERFVAWGMILTVWGNFGFFIASALGAPGRGLSMDVNKFGGGDLFSRFNFLIAYPGAFIAPIALLLVARGAFGAAKR